MQCGEFPPLSLSLSLYACSIIHTDTSIVIENIAHLCCRVELKVIQQRLLYCKIVALVVFALNSKTLRHSTLRSLYGQWKSKDKRALLSAIKTWTGFVHKTPERRNAKSRERERAGRTAESLAHSYAAGSTRSTPLVEARDTLDIIFSCVRGAQI